MPHDVKSENGTPIDIAELAEILSTGDAHREGTPFLEDGLRWKKSALKALIKLSYNNFLKTGKHLTERLGVAGVSAVKEFVMGNHGGYKKAPATVLAESSKKARKSGKGQKTTPLIDTAQMIGALGYIVRKGKVKVK